MSDNKDIEDININKEIQLEPVSALSEEDINLAKEEPEEEPPVEEPKFIKFTLRLGDVIVIQAPTNEILNTNTFFIEYIDKQKIKLVNVENFEKTQLRINKTGTIGDGSITEIKIISSNPNRGYARQHGLLTGTWINIHFGGDIPFIITGQITDLEKDMIEVKTVEGETIYINFAYHGIPEDLPIDAFEIRPPPEEVKEKEKEAQAEDLGEEKEAQEEINSDLEEGEIDEPYREVPVKKIKANVERLVFNANDIVFGDTINIQQFVEIDKDKYRFDIETQTNDMLEEMLSTIPNVKRSSNVLNKLHIMITRFIQLRELSSNFDKNKNVIGFIKKGANDKPLAEYLSEFKNTLYWVMLVA